MSCWRDLMSENPTSPGGALVGKGTAGSSGSIRSRRTLSRGKCIPLETSYSRCLPVRWTWSLKWPMEGQRSRSRRVRRVSCRAEPGTGKSCVVATIEGQPMARARSSGSVQSFFGSPSRRYPASPLPTGCRRAANLKCAALAPPPLPSSLGATRHCHHGLLEDRQLDVAPELRLQPLDDFSHRGAGLHQLDRRRHQVLRWCGGLLRQPVQ